MSRIKYKEVANILIPFDLDGNGFNMGKVSRVDESWSEENIKAARYVIALHFDKRVGITRNNYNSYNLKHIVERHPDYMPPGRELPHRGYLSNGELIVAMIAEGYDFRRVANSPNCFFNVDRGSVYRIEQ